LDQENILIARRLGACCLDGYYEDLQEVLPGAGIGEDSNPSRQENRVFDDGVSGLPVNRSGDLGSVVGNQNDGFLAADRIELNLTFEDTDGPGGKGWGVGVEGDHQYPKSGGR
jgi:hypothetical protein